MKNYYNIYMRIFLCMIFAITNQSLSMSLPWPDDPCLACCAHRKEYLEETRREIRRQSILPMIHKHEQKLKELEQPAAPQAQEMSDAPKPIQAKITSNTQQIPLPNN